MPGKNRVFTKEFKVGVVQRILKGEGVSALHHELHIKRSVLYRWRDAYRKGGAAGLQRNGRPSSIPAARRAGTSSGETALRRVAELERKIGQQAVDLDFLHRAFKRVRESRGSNTAPGGTASTGRSEA